LPNSLSGFSNILSSSGIFSFSSVPRERGRVCRGSGLFLGLGGRRERTYITESDVEEGLGDTKKQIEDPSQCLNLADKMQESGNNEEEAEVWSYKVEWEDLPLARNSKGVREAQHVSSTAASVQLTTTPPLDNCVGSSPTSIDRYSLSPTVAPPPFNIDKESHIAQFSEEKIESHFRFETRHG
jgi:hypothetical protein